MLYIPCVEFQFCIHYVQLPFEKKGYLRFPRGGKTLARGGRCPPLLNETLTWILHTKVRTYLAVLGMLIWAGTLVIILLRLDKFCLCLHSAITTRPRRKSKQ